MENFDYEEFTIKNFSKLVPNNFVGKYIAYPCAEKDLFFAHKNYDFILNVFHECDGIIREDKTNFLKIYMHRERKENVNQGWYTPVKNLFYYTEREVLDLDFVIDNGHIKRLSGLSKRHFNNCIFEKVIGVKFERKFNATLYHTYIQAPDFYGLTEETPESLKEKLENIVANGMREIHDKGIMYSDPLPGNMKYNFNDKLILSPHNCIRTSEFKKLFPRETFDSDEMDIARDLAIVIYTHDWITNPERFLGKYLGNNENKMKDMSGLINCFLGELEDGDVSGLSRKWQKRGKYKKLKE